jgi:hypothetical protein
VAGVLTGLVLLQVSLTLLASNFNKFIMNDNVFELINLQSKSLAIKVHSFESDEYFSDLNKYNYFLVILVLAGTGVFTAPYNIPTHPGLIADLGEGYYYLDYPIRGRRHPFVPVSDVTIVSPEKIIQETLLIK